MLTITSGWSQLFCRSGSAGRYMSVDSAGKAASKAIREIVFFMLIRVYRRSGQKKAASMRMLAQLKPSSTGCSKIVYCRNRLLGVCQRELMIILSSLISSSLSLINSMPRPAGETRAILPVILTGTG